MPGVVCYDNSPFAGILAGLYDMVCDSLCGASYGKAVHAVGSHTYFAAKSGSSEGEVLIKSVL